MGDAGSRQRRHRVMQRVRLRRQRGELTRYSFQIRLLIRGALRQRHQHRRVLLLRQLNILQCRADNGIRYRDRSRLVRRLCGEATEIRQREIRQPEKRLKCGKEKFGKELAVAAPMMARADSDTRITGTRLDAACCVTSGCLSPCVSLCGVSATCVPSCQSSRKIFPRRRSGKRARAVAWTIHRRLSRDSPPKFGSKHGLIWLMIGYSLAPLRSLSRSSRAGVGVLQHNRRRNSRRVSLTRRALRARRPPPQAGRWGCVSIHHDLHEVAHLHLGMRVEPVQHAKALGGAVDAGHAVGERFHGVAGRKPDIV